MDAPGLGSHQESQVLSPNFGNSSETFMQKKLCQVKNIFLVNAIVDFVFGNVKETRIFPIKRNNTFFLAIMDTKKNMIRSLPYGSL